MQVLDELFYENFKAAKEEEAEEARQAEAQAMAARKNAVGCWPLCPV